MSIDNKLEIVIDVVKETFDVNDLAFIFGPFKDLLLGEVVDFGSMMTSAMSFIKHCKEIPNRIFYNKLYTVLNDMKVLWEDKIKLSEKLRNKIGSDVKAQQQFLAWVDSITDLSKIKYYANAFSCFLNCEIEVELLFKIINLLERLTSFDLGYIALFGYDESKALDVQMSYLLDELIFIQGDGDYYHLTRLGKMFKQNCLNYDSGTGGNKRITSVDELEKSEISETVVIGYI